MELTQIDKPDKKADKMSKNEIIKIENMTKSFDENSIFENFNFSVKEGEVVTIIGSSGCGKSTLLRTMNGLEDIQEGNIYFHDEKISQNKESLIKLRKKVGMVFQNYELFPHKTVLENITLAPRKVLKISKEEAEKEALALLERVGLADKKDAYPRTLSGGQKQRVAIVRALSMHPEVLLFDEVTAALDPEMVREVLLTILELAKGGQTMVIVTHEMAFAKAVSDRIVFLDEGKIAEESDNPKEFFENPKTERAQKFLESFEYD